MRVIFDMDDVLVNLVETWIKEINDKWERNVTINDIREWDITRPFPGIKKEDIFGFLSCSWFWERVTPREYAVEYLKKFNEEHEIYIATYAYTKTIDAKINHCLFKYFPFLHEHHIITIKNKSLLDCDWFVDDNPENLKDSRAKRILIDRPWNRSYIPTHYDYRRNNLKEVYDLITNYK